MEITVSNDIGIEESLSYFSQGKGKSSKPSTVSKVPESPVESKPMIEIVMDDDVDDMATLQHHYGSTSLSRMDTFILPSKVSRRCNIQIIS